MNTRMSPIIFLPQTFPGQKHPGSILSPLPNVSSPSPAKNIQALFSPLCPTSLPLPRPKTSRLYSPPFAQRLFPFPGQKHPGSILSPLPNVSSPSPAKNIQALFSPLCLTSLPLPRPKTSRLYSLPFAWRLFLFPGVSSISSRVGRWEILPPPSNLVASRGSFWVYSGVKRGVQSKPEPSQKWSRAWEGRRILWVLSSDAGWFRFWARATSIKCDLYSKWRHEFVPLLILQMRCMHTWGIDLAPFRYQLNPLFTHETDISPLRPQKASRENGHNNLLDILCCPAMFGHFSPAPVKTDRTVQIQ